MSRSDMFLCISRSMHIIYLLTTANASISDDLFIYLVVCHISLFFFFFSDSLRRYIIPQCTVDECCIVSNGKSFSVIQGILPSLIFSNQFKRFMFRLGWNTEAYNFWSNHTNTNTSSSSVSMQWFLVTEEMRTLHET